MKLQFNGDWWAYQKGLALACAELGVVNTYEHGEDGEAVPIRVRLVADQGGLHVCLRDGQGEITFAAPVQLYRGLAIWTRLYREGGDFYHEEKLQFDSCGVMVDVSRNAVLDPEAIHKLLRMMALMGFNRLMLYTEDVYEIEGRPYFGYMRGRYSQVELKQIDDYADALGIELVPCIQTLGHLAEALKWNDAEALRDTSDILLVGEEQTYQFIAEMLHAATAPLRSRKIHIGMDEAHQLGLGRYLEMNGYRQRFDIMNAHLQRVTEIAHGQGLELMIWSDMYFRLGSKTGDYYDPEVQIPEEVIVGLPADIQLVYWDYYNDDPDVYRRMIRSHYRFGAAPVFAGGAWTWHRIAPNQGKAFATSEAALVVCKEEGVREVMVTIWGDNGAETSIFAGLPTLQLYAEHCYSAEVNLALLSKQFEVCTGGKLDSFLDLQLFDETPGVALHNPYESNPSKMILWQDVLLGLFDANVQELPLKEHYIDLASKMREHALNRKWGRMFDFYAVLAEVLALKCDLGLRLREAYITCNSPKLLELEQEMLQLSELVDLLRKTHRELWMADCKPFGWEVLDIRYGGVLARLESARARIADYREGRIRQLEELEQERLYYDMTAQKQPGTLGIGFYHRIVTAGTFSGF